MQRGPGQPWDGATGAIAVQTHTTPPAPHRALRSARGMGRAAIWTHGPEPATIRPVNDYRVVTAAGRPDLIDAMRRLGASPWPECKGMGVKSPPRYHPRWQQRAACRTSRAVESSRPLLVFACPPHP